MMRSMCSLLLCLLILCPAASAGETELRTAPPAVIAPFAPVQSLVGERLVYDIAFLWFDRVAEGEIRFAAGGSPVTFRAVLEARTLGVAAFLTRHQVQRYEASMELRPDGSLRPLSFEYRIIRGRGKRRKDRSKRFLFDYRQRQVGYQRAKDGDFGAERFFPIPEGEGFYDLLTAFYNFRIGVFGQVLPGRRYVIPSFSSKGAGEIVIETLTAAPEQIQAPSSTGGLFCRVTADPEIFDTGGGSIYVWFDEFGRPARGIVQNVIGLGDVRGRLRSERK